jgi:hypothetical protein
MQVGSDTTATYLTNDDTPTMVGTGEIDSLITIKNATGSIV